MKLHKYIFKVSTVSAFPSELVAQTPECDHINVHKLAARGTEGKYWLGRSDMFRMN